MGLPSPLSAVMASVCLDRNALIGGIVGPAIVPIVVGSLAAFVANGRWRVAPIHATHRRSLAVSTLAPVVSRIDKAA